MGVATQDPNSDSGLTSIPPSKGVGGVKSGSLTYPIDMDLKQDRIKFVTWKVKKGGSISDKSLFERIGETAFLPIQPSITDQNSVNWGAGELNELQRIAVNASLQFMRNGPDAVANQFQVAFNKLFSSQGQLTTFGKQFQNFGQLALAEQALGINNLLSRATGGVLNPNLELLFQGPTLRPFNFTFKMSPRSKKEADSVKGIINYFKRNMAVQRVPGNLFLKAPYVFEIEYQKGTTQHQSINLIKICALQSCSVDYTPLGSYMTYDDQVDRSAPMVSYNMSLQFQEINPVYADEYGAHPIGY